MTRPDLIWYQWYAVMENPSCDGLYLEEVDTYPKGKNGEKGKKKGKYEKDAKVDEEEEEDESHLEKDQFDLHDDFYDLARGAPHHFMTDVIYQKKFKKKCRIYDGKGGMTVFSCNDGRLMKWKGPCPEYMLRYVRNVGIKVLGIAVTFEWPDGDGSSSTFPAELR